MTKITKEEYLRASKIVSEYNKQRFNSLDLSIYDHITKTTKIKDAKLGARIIEFIRFIEFSLPNYNRDIPLEEQYVSNIFKDFDFKIKNYSNFRRAGKITLKKISLLVSKLKSLKEENKQSELIKE